MVSLVTQNPGSRALSRPFVLQCVGSVVVAHRRICPAACGILPGPSLTRVLPPCERFLTTREVLSFSLCLSLTHPLSVSQSPPPTPVWLFYLSLSLSVSCLTLPVSLCPSAQRPGPGPCSPVPSSLERLPRHLKGCSSSQAPVSCERPTGRVQSLIVIPNLEKPQSPPWLLFPPQHSQTVTSDLLPLVLPLGNPRSPPTPAPPQ